MATDDQLHEGLAVLEGATQELIEKDKTATVYENDFIGLAVVVAALLCVAHLYG